MRILFADSIDDDRLEPLRRQGHELVVDARLSVDDLPSNIGGFDGLVVRSTKVDEATMAAADKLGLIVRAGAGTDNIDTIAASRHGVYVCNVPGRNAVAVAELTMGLLLALDRRIPDNVIDLRADRWNKGLYSQADGVLGKTIAIIGLGDIGLAVAERAKAFGMTITARRRDNRSATAQARIRTIGIRLTDTDEELIRGADVVSLHLPKAEGTSGWVDAEFLALMKQGAILINTSRSDIVDEQALLAAIDERDLRVALDVWPGEPGAKSAEFHSALAQHANVIGTHHIGASTAQAQASIADGTVEVIQAYLDGEVKNCVNLDANATGTGYVSVRHIDRVGVLAQVFAVLRANGLSVKQMQNQIFTGADSAVATINVDGVAPADVLDQLSAIDEVMATSFVAAD